MPKSSDEVIKKDVVDELYWDNRTDAAKINVSVDQGVVTLSGEVPSYKDLVAAENAAWRMAGVVDLINQLTVSYTPPPPVPADQHIERRVNEILAGDSAVNAENIIVSVHNRMVKLEGNVDAYWKKSHVTSLLSGVAGVQGIENQLTVTPMMRVSDQVIADNVSAAMGRNPLIDQSEVTVEVQNGVVTLTGAVPNWYARQAADSAACFTEGVIGVNNKLMITP